MGLVAVRLANLNPLSVDGYVPTVRGVDVGCPRTGPRNMGPRYRDPPAADERVSAGDAMDVVPVPGPTGRCAVTGVKHAGAADQQCAGGEKCETNVHGLPQM